MTESEKAAEKMRNRPCNEMNFSDCSGCDYEAQCPSEKSIDTAIIQTAIDKSTADLQAEVERLNQILQIENPWPLPDIIRKLIEAVEYLLHDLDCDVHGWELYARAVTGGKDWLKAIKGKENTNAKENS